MKFCKVSDIIDWQDVDFQSTASLLRLSDKSRKMWEFIQVYRGLEHLGVLNPEAKGLGLGVGTEPLIYAFTNVCKEITATDLYDSQTWTTAAVSLNDVYAKSFLPYRQDRLIVRNMSMTDIEYPDESFDFVWSCCAIEHVNNFRELHRVYQEIHRVLKPGGIAALTTEFNATNLNSYEPNMLFTDQYWIEQWFTGGNPVVQGLELLDHPDLSITPLPANEPLPRSQPPISSIQIYAYDIIINSLALFVRKNEDFSPPYCEYWLPNFWKDYLAACDKYREGNLSEAEALLKQVLKNTLEPRLRVKAISRIADTLNAQSKLQELVELCKESIIYCEDSEDTDHLINLAHYCKQANLLKEAAFLYEKVANLPGSHIDSILYSLIANAICFELQGKYQEALELIAKAEQKLLPGFSADLRHEIYFRRGSCYENLGKNETAAKFYLLAMNLCEKDSKFYENCHLRLSSCTSFPDGDQCWVKPVNFMRTYFKEGDKVIAPIEFGNKFTGIYPYSSSMEEVNNWKWAVIHKGRIEQIDKALLQYINEEFIPVFANEVFVVFSSYRQIPSVDRTSPDVMYFTERLRSL